MSGKLLDTNAVIALQASDPDIMALFDSEDEIILPVIVVGELAYGAHNSSRVTENLQELDEFITANRVLTCDAVTGKVYGSIRYQLKTKSRPIPLNDVWIAALAIQHNLTLLTRDEHFQFIDGLGIEQW